MPETQIIDLAAIVAAKLTEHLEKNFQVIPMLTLAQAAEAVGVSDEKMRQLCNSGEIPFIKLDRLYRIKPSDINNYLESHYSKKEKNK